VALRQTADVHLSRGDTVEAIKKLKLFRGLSPGDREVNELIRQLDGELAAAAAPRPPIRTEREVPPPPAPEFRTGGVPVQRARPAASAPVARDTAASALPSVPPLPAVLEAKDMKLSPASELQDWLETPPERPAPSAPPLPLLAPATEPTGFESGESTLAESNEFAESARPGSDVLTGASAVGAGTLGVPAVTETLATLLRAQGHLGEAHVVYQELARTEADPERARRLLGVVEEISTVRAGTVRGRLEAWVEPFSKSLGRRDVNLSAAVEEVVERLGPSAAVVTDFEGVPVVDAGPRSEAEAMENLSAELTAFWKNVRRSRAEIGEGALDSFVLSGSAGTVAVKAITPAYALLLKAGPGIPIGRLRFEAVRAAGKLRPSLV
jgi:predicted regulator of Ras-like GTPase activity (Roadblock/LC7/MglB family)